MTYPHEKKWPSVTHLNIKIWLSTIFGISSQTLPEKIPSTVSVCLQVLTGKSISLSYIPSGFTKLFRLKKKKIDDVGCVYTGEQRGEEDEKKRRKI